MKNESTAEDAKAVACTLTRQRLSKESTGFNRPLQYGRWFIETLL